jgi:hypothetical protein
MRPDSRKAITLLELIISTVLLGMVVLGFYSIDLFSRNQFLTADRRAKMLNEAFFVVGHMSKQLMTAIGSANAVAFTTAGGMTATITATVDSTPDGAWNSTNDSTIRYTYNSASFTLDFNPNITAMPAPTPEILATHVKYLNAYQTGNCVSVNIMTCWDPAESQHPCGSLANPSFNITSAVKMPSVSTQ